MDTIDFILSYYVKFTIDNMEKHKHYNDLQNQHFKKLNDQFGSIPNCLQLSQDQVRGIKTKCNINKGKTIIEVPYQFILYPNTTSHKISPLLIYIKLICFISNQYKVSQASEKAIRQIKRSLSTDQQSFYNFLYLLEQKYLHFQHPKKHVQDVHQAYISLLPKDYNYHPLNHFNIFQSIQQYIYHDLVCLRKEVTNFHRKINDILTLSFEGRSFKSFLKYKNMQHLYQRYQLMFSFQNAFWGRLVLQTRQFSGSWLIPMLDMFNHSPQQNAQWSFNHKTKKVKLISKRFIKSGEEIFVSYGGDRSKYDLFLTYGFHEPAKQKQNGLKKICFELPEFESEEDRQKYIEINDLQKFLDSQEERELIIERLQRQINENTQLSENQLKLLKMLRILMKEQKYECDCIQHVYDNGRKQMKNSDWK